MHVEHLWGDDVAIEVADDHRTRTEHHELVVLDGHEAIGDPEEGGDVRGEVGRTLALPNDEG